MQHNLGVRAYSLKDIADLIAIPASSNGLDSKRLTSWLVPRHSDIDAAGLKRLGRFDELTLLTPVDDRFARIFKARDPWTGDRVLLHCYDLSAAPADEPIELTERRARREFDVIRRFQKSPYLPSLVDSWQGLPNYVGEMCFFSISDSAATSVADLMEQFTWRLGERRKFAIDALSALEDFAQGSDGPLLHRALDPQSVRVRADNTPLFAGWRWARLSQAQTVASHNGNDELGTYAAPEIKLGGLSAATSASDLYSLCAVLAELFPNDLDHEAKAAIALGLAQAPQNRPAPSELIDLLTEIEPDISEPATTTIEPVSPSRWDEGYSFEWKDARYRVISVLGQGGAGRTFKLEQLSGDNDEPIGTFVGKAVFNPEFGQTSHAAYQRLRPLSLREGMSNILECASRWDPNELMVLLRWAQGSPLDTWRGDVEFVAQVIGAGTAEQLVLCWFEILCSALDTLHAQGWVHGDVSPSNILVDEDRAVIIDYDLAGPTGHQPKTRGTILYVSPERLHGGPVYPRDDVYGLAASLFHVITNRPPTLASDGSGLSWTHEERIAFPRLSIILDHATAFDAAARFPDAAAALRQLRIELPVTNLTLWVSLHYSLPPPRRPPMLKILIIEINILTAC